MAAHVLERQRRFVRPLKAGLLSVITAVWDGSPVRYLEQLAGSLAGQNENGACEWVILDNGCTRSPLLRYLNNLQGHEWVRVLRVDGNIGIVRGLRRCLEQASNRYVLPVDADDYLYSDALKVITSYLEEAGCPALLYTDEDKISGRDMTQPYFKPDWDPVLLANSAYIAHLGVIDRCKALELGAYTDPEAEGSPDWDLFIRFANAGHAAIHIPEVVYSWRLHARSTADDETTKPYIFRSQRAVLKRFLDERVNGTEYTIENSSLIPGAHWHFVRKQRISLPMKCILLQQAGQKHAREPAVRETRLSLECVHLPVNAKVRALSERLDEIVSGYRFVCLMGGDLEPDGDEWPLEAFAIFDLFPDTVMIGGRIWNRKGVITEADEHFGFGNSCGSPNSGRLVSDPGYFAQMWKQRSTSAVSVQFAVVEFEFLRAALERIPQEVSLSFLGPWLGAQAKREGKRIVYTPFLGGTSETEWDQLLSDADRKLFRERNADLIPDRRFYPKPFSLKEGFVIEQNLE
jgi:glycosyltransferase involved in cell wall biosynthesis